MVCYSATVTSCLGLIADAVAVVASTNSCCRSLVADVNSVAVAAATDSCSTFVVAAAAGSCSSLVTDDGAPAVGSCSSLVPDARRCCWFLLLEFGCRCCRRVLRCSVCALHSCLARDLWQCAPQAHRLCSYLSQDSLDSQPPVTDVPVVVYGRVRSGSSEFVFCGKY